MDISTLCQLPNAVATPVTNRVYRLHVPCKMEIVPGDQQNAVSGEILIDTLDSNTSLGENCTHCRRDWMGYVRSHYKIDCCS